MTNYPMLNSLSLPINVQHETKYFTGAEFEALLVELRDFPDININVERRNGQWKVHDVAHDFHAWNSDRIFGTVEERKAAAQAKRDAKAAQPTVPGCPSFYVESSHGGGDDGYFCTHPRNHGGKHTGGGRSWASGDQNEKRFG